MHGKLELSNYFGVCFPRYTISVLMVTVRVLILCVTRNAISAISLIFSFNQDFRLQKSIERLVMTFIVDGYA
jgi:hypothetical protein